MPLVRYEHSLVDPELYRKALVRGAGGDDSSRALLEAVAVAGLVGIVRPLVDLAGFSSKKVELSGEAQILVFLEELEEEA
ncbi:unnamed protein product [Sphagnum balticum]